MGAIQQALARYGMISAERIKQNIASSGESATGETASEIKWSTPTETNVIVSGPPHVYVLETGRGPNKNQSPQAIKGFVGWAGNTFMRQWTIAKGVDYNPFAISAVIAKRGSYLFRIGGRRDILTPVVKDDQSVQQLQKEVADILLNLTVEAIDKRLN